MKMKESSRRRSWRITKAGDPHQWVRSVRAIAVVLMCLSASASPAAPAPWVAVADDGRGFVLTPSGKSFIPWGFNYVRDYNNLRLIEDYWDADWSTIEQRFMQMKQLGANVVRIHLQFARFMDAPDKTNKLNLARLAKLVRLAESHGLYLDLTGLGSYRETDAPVWYDALSERDRWAAQAHFWEAIASICADRPGVFAYNLMNEPLVSEDRRLPREWALPAKRFPFRFRESINLDTARRERSAIAQQWLRQMVQAIRKHDKRHLVTVGLVSIAISGRPEEEAGFLPSIIAPELDFLSVHVYPASGKLDLEIDTLKRYNVGKPVVIEEMFPLRCNVKELGMFIERSRTIANGWIGFYWGQTPQELKRLSGPGAARTLRWLELFEAMNPNR